jgi:hypothetical protein
MIPDAHPRRHPPPEIVMTPRRTSILRCLLPVLLLTAACTGQRQPAAPMEPGTYSFNGSGRTTAVSYPERQEPVTVVVMGTVELLENGAMVVSGSPGSCTFPPQSRPVMSIRVRCGGMALDLASNSGTAEVTTTVIAERRGRCQRYETDAAGRSTGVCLSYDTEQFRRNVRMSVPLVVSRLRDSPAGG